MSSARVSFHAAPRSYARRRTRLCFLQYFSPQVGQGRDSARTLIPWGSTSMVSPRARNLRTLSRVAHRTLQYSFGDPA